MKKLFLFFLLLAATQFGFAQTTTISGTVKDDEKQPVHFAFIKDAKSKAATYSDSLGNYNLVAAPNSFLYVNCVGYKDTVIKIDNRVNIDIVLRTEVTISAAKTKRAEPNRNADAIMQQLTSMERDNFAGPGKQSGRQQTFQATQGSILVNFYPKGETVGSRYLLKGWMHGYVINSQDSTVQDPNLLFAYDKIGGALLLTKDEQSALEINRATVKSFTIYDNTNTAYTFANVPTIDAAHYVQVLASGNNYNIYKAIKTHIELANYTTDGVMSRGHVSDEYIDEYTYYVYDVKANTFQEIALKKKALKLAFAKDADKLSKFFSDNSGTIDDFYLTNLGAFMNE
jgi:hypothetical protein